ncbi:MAG: hypothetical protein SOV90_10010 [Lachnospiraceae bacterium]|nr:hypothetical protein [Clostridiales bacterium]MDD6293586.1 hypothetical protein [Eubacteriales bacterium]MDY2608238.1 hypothetical protein [Lachnospiraceae bacterium]
MRTFKVSETLKDYINNVLKRRGYDYSYNDDGTINVEMSGQNFHKVVVRAKMEKLTDEKNSSISYVATTERDSSLVISEIGDTFIIDDKNVSI